MGWLFALSLPGLVVVLIAAGVVQLVFFRRRNKNQPGAGSIGFDLLDVALRPGREHLINERESKHLFQKEDEEGAPPRTRVNLTSKVARIVRPSGPSTNGESHKADEDGKREGE
jgi:Na+/phosphate symporter